MHFDVKQMLIYQLVIFLKAKYCKLSEKKTLNLLQVRKKAVPLQSTTSNFKLYLSFSYLREFAREGQFPFLFSFIYEHTCRELHFSCLT